MLKSGVNTRFTIFLVDDDPVEKRLVRRTFAKINLGCPVVEAEDGEEALAMLRNRGKNELPERIGNIIALVDINMPKVDGHSFLKEVKSDSELKPLLVYVLSTSSLDKDIAEAYRNHAAGYLVKGPDLSSYIEKAEFVQKLMKVIETPSQ